MAQPKSVKKKGRSVLEKRRLKQEKLGTEVKRKRKGDRFDVA